MWLAFKSFFCQQDGFTLHDKREVAPTVYRNSRLGLIRTPIAYAAGSGAGTIRDLNQWGLAQSQCRAMSL